MKTLVVYYSKTGNTKRVAEDLAQKLGADLEEIIDKKNRSGFWNWFLAGRDGMKKNGTEIGELHQDPANYDVVIIGSPVWGWNLVPAVRTFLETQKGKINRWSFFVTSGNTASEKLEKSFREIMNVSPLAHTGFNTKELKEKNLYEQKMTEFLGRLN